MLEGPDLVESALASGAEFEALYVDAAQVDRRDIARLLEVAHASGVRIFSLEPGVIERVADAQTPQPVLASVRFDVPEVTSLEVSGLVVVVHDLRDPGNAGTIIRSADAAGVASVVFTGHSVDPFNPKTLRASAGSIFHLPVAVGRIEETIQHFSRGGAQVVASVVSGGTSHRDVDFTKATVVVVGNEAQGLDAGTIALCDSSVTISIAGASESLNAGVAASLIAFEAMWQRQDSSIAPSPPSL